MRLPPLVLVSWAWAVRCSVIKRHLEMRTSAVRSQTSMIQNFGDPGETTSQPPSNPVRLSQPSHRVSGSCTCISGAMDEVLRPFTNFRGFCNFDTCDVLRKRDNYWQIKYVSYCTSLYFIVLFVVLLLQVLLLLLSLLSLLSLLLSLLEA